LKGKAVRLNLLCQLIPPPPPSVNVVPIPVDPTKTERALVEQTTASATCQACHQDLNPLGFTTESYDSLGRYRTTESKYDATGALVASLPVNTAITSGLLYGTDMTPAADNTALAANITSSGVGQQCLVRQYFRFAQGRQEADQDGCDLEQLRQKLVGSGGGLREMLKEMAKRPSFRERKVGP
jgi:hypothetical protein